MGTFAGGDVQALLGADCELLEGVGVGGGVCGCWFVRIPQRDYFQLNIIRHLTFSNIALLILSSFVVVLLVSPGVLSQTFSLFFSVKLILLLGTPRCNTLSMDSLLSLFLFLLSACTCSCIQVSVSKT